MTRPAVGTVAVGLVIANAALMTATVGLAVATRPAEVAREWREWLLFAMPSLWLVAAGWLARDGRRAAWVAAVVAVASLFLTYSLFEDIVEGAGWGVRGVLPRWASRIAGDVLPMPALLAAVAVVPAGVGWWQRRQDRLTDPDSDA